MTTASISELPVGHRLPAREFGVTRADVVRYAGASGDFNPLHYDDESAQAAGMSRPFAHGMYSAGCLATAVTAVGDVQSLTRFTVRFRRQARLGTTLTSHVVVTGTRRAGDGVLVDLECHLTDEDAAVVVSGTATLSTPPGLPDADEADVSLSSSASELLGTRLAPALVKVERGPVQVFAAAVGDDNPAYRSVDAAAACGLNGIPAPPTYLFAVQNWGAFDDEQPQADAGSASIGGLIALLRNGRRGVILHGEQDFTYYRPVIVGDVLRVDGRVEGVERKAPRDGRPAMTAMVVRTDYRDERATLVTTARATYLFRPEHP